MKATIVVEMNNAVFDDQPGSELARILLELAQAIEWDGGDANGDSRTLRDINGNPVGTFRVTGRLA